MIKKKKKNLYKQRLHVKKLLKKFLNLIKLLFPWKYRFAFHSVPSTEMSSSEYRNVAYVQYRDVLIPIDLGFTVTNICLHWSININS